MRLGVYVDLVFRREGGVVSADRAFVDFVSGLVSSLDELTFFGRLDPSPCRAPHPLPADRVRFVALPYYPSTAAVWQVTASARDAVAAFVRELPRLDAVWLFGPHPLALLFAHAARAHRVPVFLGIRQDLPRYAAARTRGVARAWKLPAAYALELAFRRLARRVPAVVVGDDLAQRYAGGAAMLPISFSLVREEDVMPLDEALARSWDEEEIRLLTVTRLSPEKNPLLLADTLFALRRAEPRWRLTVAGEGPLRGRLVSRAAALGIDGALRPAGYIPSGASLRALYRNSHAFVHVSLTEGFPQVLLEAQAAGLPVVATDVGGVRAALAAGESGILVPPRNAEAAAAALESIRQRPELRRRLIVAGLQAVAGLTMERQLALVSEFMRENLRSPASHRQMWG